MQLLIEAYIAITACVVALGLILHVQTAKAARRRADAGSKFTK